MVDAPLNIRLFEALQLVSFFVGLIHAFVDGALMINAVGVAIGILLTLLVSRGRKNWARWTLLVLFVLGAAFLIWQVQAVLSHPYPLATALVWLMQAVALVLVFTPQSRRWLTRDESNALHQVFE